MDASSNSNNQGNGGSAGQTNSNNVNKADQETTNTAKPLNSGAWTTEEFQYMLALMEAFKAGHLPLPEGTTLRSFLSSMLHCKPKRISKKFEGITYNGRLTYRKTKDPFSIQAAMLVRAQLSELERRYLLAAADKQRGPSQQDDGAATLDAMFIGGQQQQQQQTNAAGGSSVASLAWGSSLGVNHSSASPASFLGGGDLVGLGASFGAGLGAGLLEPTPLSPGLLLSPDNMRRLQNLPQAAQVGYGSDLFLSSSNPSTTASAGALLNQQQQQQLAANNALLSTQALMGDYQAQLRKVEQLQQQQQRLAALSAANNAGASSGIGTTLPAVSSTTGNGGMNASISNATRQLLNQRSGWMSLGGGGGVGGGSGSSSAAPTSTANTSAASGFLPGLPTSTGGGSNTLPLSSSINTGSNSADPLNRFVLPAPVDDASFFRQRLLPHVAGPGVGGSGNSNTATSSTTSMVGSMRLLDANFNNTTTTHGAAASSSVGGSGMTGRSNQDPSIDLLLQNNGSGGGGALSNLLKRHREENDQLNLTQFGTATKRSR